MSDDVFAGEDLATEVAPQTDAAAPQSGGGRFSDELLSKKIKGRQRTFFIDLKESVNGKFVKISELSRGGQRSTIMFDGEDIESFIEALQEIKASL